VLNARVSDLLSDRAGDRLSDAWRSVDAAGLLRLAELSTGADDAKQQRGVEDLVEVLVDVRGKPE